MDELERNVNVEQEDLSATEAELRHCLQHVAAPVGFEDRVMARVGARTEAREGARSKARAVRPATLHRSAGWWTAVAATLLLAAGGDVMHQRHMAKEREAAQVQTQMDLALQLTNHALNEVQVGLDRTPAGRYTQMLEQVGR